MNLQEKYNRDEYLEFLKSFIPKFEKDVRRVGTNRLQVTKDIFYLGKSEDLDLEIFELTHSSSSDARVSLAMDGFRIMKNSATYRALIAYRSEKGDDWRLSLMTATPDINQKGKVVQSLSNPRRYSFFLGPNAKVNTPYQFLVKQGRVINFEDLQNRFSVEVVNKEFYKKIQEAYYKLVGGTLGEGKKAVTFKPLLHLPSQTDHSQICLEFAVRLIGRIIFCWFLREKKSPTGIALMPKDLLSLKAIPLYADYYHQILEPIFFEVLNKPIKLRGKRYSDNPFSFIPYLNGGLFSPHEDDYYKGSSGIQSIYHNTLVIPDDWFVNFFNILETYNFTIDENTSFDEELSIDPEMLGRIFENLLAEINPDTGESARKSTGSYYTPRVIVDYMVDESLLLFLKQQTGLEDEKLRAIISYNLSDDSKYPLNEKENQRIVNALENLKLLDPACGSGAFPIGALQKIVFMLQQIDPNGEAWLKKQLEKASPEFRKDILKRFSNKELNYLRKLGIIRECIFGVDIQPIAIEISRLRCFLTLIVDEHINDQEENRGIKPLPNLDFKFVAADSLISPPEEGSQTQDSFSFSEFQSEFEFAVSEYFGVDDAEIKNNAISKLHKLIDSKIEEKVNIVLMDKGLSKGDKFQKIFKDDKKKVHSMLLKEASMWKSYKNIFENKKVDFFHPRYFFPSVKDGFDIVIANPPYISVEKFSRTALQTEWKKKFKTYASRGDIYCFFYEQGFSLLHNNGVLTFISSNKFQRAGYGKGLRQLLASQQIQVLIDFCELPVFAASTDPMIVIVSKASKPIDFPVLVVKDESELGSLRQSIVTRASRYMTNQLKIEGWSLEGVHGLALVEKLRTKGTQLGKYVKKRFFRGIITGLNEAFVIDSATRDRLIREDRKSSELIKPWIRGIDIKRWTHEFYDLYVIIVPYDFHKELKKYPAILRHLSNFEDKLKERGQCKTSRSGASEGQHHWLELDNNPSESYIAAFEEPKIVFNETSKCLHAYLDIEGNMINKTGFIILTPEAPYVLAVLNSKLLDWFYRSTFPSWGDPWNSGRVQFRGNLMNKVPIPPANSADKSHLSKLAKRAADLASVNDEAGVVKVERDINEIIYRLFDLTPEEIAIVEDSYKKD